ncbi:MIT domain-containing protein 1 [Cichlidogyrus casuarinus]|uniref:MIT domain-containing protein 1 n=1 Tax=Cichlidogyrus casuarinus TaxID=1844966 RepID=A0ABD2Q7G5_9PLAT
MTRAEAVKKSIQSPANRNNYREQIQIKEGAKGFGYKKLFDRFLEQGDVTKVWVEDPYIRSSHQIENFCHFCEVVLASQSSVSSISLITTKDAQANNSNPKHDQVQKFHILKNDLATQNVNFKWEFDASLHDREIRFDNGWIVKIGRGLDYVRSTGHHFCGLGVHDYDYRPCSSTTVDIFHQSTLANSQ